MVSGRPIREQSETAVRTRKMARHAHRPDPRHPLVPLCEGVLSTEDPETLVARGDLATWTGRAGDPADTAEIFRRLGLKLTYHPGTSGHHERHPGSKPDIGQL
jgi:hypothetical protein